MKNKAKRKKLKANLTLMVPIETTIRWAIKSAGRGSTGKPGKTY